MYFGSGRVPRVGGALVLKHVRVQPETRTDFLPSALQVQALKRRVAYSGLDNKAGR
jgi:hypothetical protein